MLVILHLVYVVGYTFAVRQQATEEGRWRARSKGEVRRLLQVHRKHEARVWPGTVLFVLLLAAKH